MIDERQTTIEDLGAVIDDSPVTPEEEEWAREVVVKEQPDPRSEIDLPVHPVADLFPMMSDSELDDLAADIKANGQLDDIVRDTDGTLVDGRNRYAACKRAGVPPRFSTLNSQDPREFILSKNEGKRRSSTQGQKAMYGVLSYWDEGLFATNKTQQFIAQKMGVGQGTIAKAVLVRKYLPGRVDAVRCGKLQLEEAWEEARRRREAELSDEAKFQRLQRSYPELAVMVQEEQLTLTGALAEAAARRTQEEDRRRKEREARESMARNWNEALICLDPRNLDPKSRAEELAALPADVLGSAVDWSTERVRRIIDVLQYYVAAKER